MFFSSSIAFKGLGPTVLDPPNNSPYFDNKVEKNWKNVVSSEENIVVNFERDLI